MAFFFFFFSFGFVAVFRAGSPSSPGAGFGVCWFFFLCLLWLLLLLLFCLRALFVSFLGLVRSGSVVLVPLFPLLRFGPLSLRSFLPPLPFRVVVLVVCVVWLVLLFRGLLFFRLLLSVVVVVRSLVVRLLWFVPFVRVRFRCGFLSLVVPALWGWFRPPVLSPAFVVWVRVRGLRLRSRAVWGCLLCCSCLLGFVLLLAGAFSRWVRGGFSALSSL